MRGDFSRVSFRPENHFSGVLFQQGRVQLDAEFNEHVDIEAHRDRATARDVMGRAGAPIDGGGFAIGVASMLRGVAAGKDAWAVGEDGTLLRSVGGTGRWTIEPIPAATGWLNAVAVAEGSGWAVGDAATVLRLAGTTWTSEPPASEITADLHGVHADDDGAWAVGADGTVLSWTGTGWELQAQNADVATTLRAVHFAGDNGFAVGEDGTILATENRGTDWITQSAPEGTGDLHGVFVADDEHAWAVGAQGAVLFFDGTAWAHQAGSPRVTATLRAVAFTSTTHGAAVGDSGVALAFDNGEWTHEATNVDADLLALVAVPGGAMLAAGDDVTLTRSGPGAAWQQAPGMPVDENDIRRGRTLVISAGDIYVDGVRCENERTVSLGRQPEPPLDPDAFPPSQAGTYGVFLHVQEQHVTATERDELREVALGGPDSASRTRTVWQAGLVDLGDGDGDGDGDRDTDPTCADVAAKLGDDRPRGRLRARAVPAPVSTSDCVVPPNGGYRRLENQLYRVEIHDGTTSGAATYTWSRDNGSVTARLEGLTTDTVDNTIDATVSHIGRDAAVGFGPEQLVELTDEGRMLRAEPGELLEIREVIGTTLVLSNPGSLALSMADFPVNPIVRRWDGRGTVGFGTWKELEDGVWVEFADGPDSSDDFRTGDYWTIPARTLTGQVEWPQTGSIPRFEERHGPRRRTTPLAVANVDANGVWSSGRDCRKVFPPLTDLVHLYYVGGDGQEVMPPVPLDQVTLVPLDQPLRVGVVNGAAPIVGATVDFEVDTTVGHGKVAEPGGNPGDTAAVVTDASGVATCEWQLDGATRTQIVEARFRDPLGQSPPQVIRFTAQLSAAEWVAYDGSGCSTLEAGKTVDAAIKTLARITRIFPLAGSGEDVLPGESIDIKVLVADECGPVDGATVAFASAPGDRGNGTIDQIQGTTANGGVASCRWTPDRTTPTQDLTAKLSSVPAPGVLHMPDVTRFVANLGLASDTAYSPPRSCPEMERVGTVQAAIDRLLRLLPRLHHVSGDGLEAPIGADLHLRVGISNRCGVDDPQIRFEQQRPDGVWEERATVGPDADGIATYTHQVTDEARQFLRALLLAAAGRPIGLPVYFTVSPSESDTDGHVPAARIEIWNGTQVADNLARTLVEFREVPAFDTDGLFDPRSDLTALRASRPGTYIATGEIAWDNTSGAGYRSVEIMQSGNPAGQVLGPPLPEGVYTKQQVTAIVRMDEGDLVQLGGTQGSGDSLLIFSATLALAWLGP